MSPNVADTIFVDRQLTLRQLQISDATALFTLIDRNRQHLGQWLHWVDEVETVGDSRYSISQHLQWRQRQEAFSFGIFLTGELLGLVTLRNLKNGLQPEIGYWISAKHAGHGYMTNAVIAISKLSFQKLKLMQIVIKVHPDNTASNRVAAKSGFRLTGQQPDENIGIANVWVLVRPIRL